ncbi:MAG: CoA transferase [Bacteriovoracaceae bacterium]|jgi:alpha-methylacyl-CoA racemase|nr:CoA transferase [Bacteriovoracaceae bacterium]
MKILTGVKILDLTTLLPGPLTGSMLEILGAEVLKIEPPQGDQARAFPELFSLLNKSKNIIKLDFKTKEGKEELYKLITSADVLIENYKPGTTDKLNINYSKLASINTKLVYCSLMGYSKNHELHHFAGHDINFLGLSGLLDLMKSEKTNSINLPNFQLADIAGGTYPALAGILGALYQVEKIKKGCHINISILENLRPFYSFILETIKESNPTYSNVLSGEQACYSVYKTSDEKYMCLGAFEEKFFQLFIMTLGLPNLIDSHLKKCIKTENVKELITKKISSQTQSYWIDLFKGIDCCFTPVLAPEEFKIVPPFYYSQV